MRSLLTPLALCLGLSACGAGGVGVSRFIEPALEATGSQRIATERPRACHSRDDTPAVIETITQQTALPPRRRPDGTLEDGPLYRTQTSQRIVSDRKEIWFETPCREEWTPEFILSVQRALIVRDLLEGPPSGEIDAPTRAAIRRFQAKQGIDSDTLSVAAGKRLGLIVYDRAEALRQAP
ncbi:hypothetical protein SAMN04488012_103292 [Palleronia salina]|uniref:Peptidoglycan binding-like domain-containing protein n=1 Tax=Palleronia salina TaxID=313368 RepID=A0A1M6F0L1_9RHOB|nr:hypothetical protein SAMN04488012_103292 [Palleronia salina]